MCVQGAMGEGIFSGMPLQLAGSRQMLERMDWGDYDAKGTFVNFGAIGYNIFLVVPHVLPHQDCLSCATKFWIFSSV